MLEIYDSLTGTKKSFEKKTGETVQMYVCGPTVYDFAHLGHGRSAVAFDLVRRSLEFMGYPVEFTFNMTDIDDKMIKRANEEGCSVKELAERITPEYEKDYSALGVKKPSHQPNATDYINEMIDLVKKLENKGHTYTLEDGVYFDITTFKEYGKLSHQKLEELVAGARIEERTDKRNHQDFVLWKFKKENEPFWKSPWGDGRPGWHIECSAMSNTILGNPFDIHGGGLDLKFPHHECEIAQSEGATENLCCDFWMHNGYITVNKEKMSKSLGNFFTLKDIFKKFEPRVVRFFLIGSHYRSPIEFNEELLEQARNTLKNLDEFYLRTKKHSKNQGSIDENLKTEFTERLSNDFDIAGALAVVQKWISNSGDMTPDTIIMSLNTIDEVLNILPKDFSTTKEMDQLLEDRKSARETKNWEKADQIRDELKNLGVEIVDAKEGSWLKPLI